MKIERLSENSIRCTLNRADLDSRELKISELAYGTEKAKTLFKDMIAQASFECGFEAEDIPLMIEAIPVSPDCIVLVITKVEDPEELDTRFSKFAPSEDDSDYEDMLDGDEDSPRDYSDPSALINKINEALNSEENFIPFLDTLGKDAKKQPETSSANTGDSSGAPAKETGQAVETVKLEKLFSFNDFSQASTAAAAVFHLFSGSSILYKNTNSLRYYLLISSEVMKPDEFTGVCNVLTEYGVREKLSYATAAYLEEHSEIIIRKDAVKILATL